MPTQPFDRAVCKQGVTGTGGDPVIVGSQLGTS
jgi:hypothetical protein